jgi:hypothetical protein
MLPGLWRCGFQQVCQWNKTLNDDFDARTHPNSGEVFSVAQTGLARGRPVCGIGYSDGELPYSQRGIGRLS